MIRHRESFSAERHRDVAAQLERMRGDLDRLGDDIGSAYGDPAAEAARQAVAAIDRIRAGLDDQLGQDFPADPAQIGAIRLGSVYCPPRWHRANRAG
jgi:hypothetical protein